ncbi:FecR family protein [Sphingomonas azotifigens]|uniref:FecR family protein n=1 Tax=Sphingomonas azotifigens TaxID=330920 RepID=UPI00142F552F|nr:FecR domain-containing protein [Sphingomonas azotifigens]
MARVDAEEAAVEWFFRLQDCEDEQPWLDHLAWMEADPAHAEAYAKVERLWIAAEALPPIAPAAADAPAEIVSLDAHRAAKQRRVARWWLPVGIAAAASVAAVIGLPQLGHLGDPAAQTYRTDGTSTKVVALADGSRLTLNRNTELTVTLGDKVRTAELRSGEAIFDVHHEPSRPFTVAAAGREVRVLGTEFDVLSQNGTFGVAVRRGLVAVSPAQDGGAVTRLPAGTGLRRVAGDTADRVEKIAPDDALAWAKGRLIYSDSPIETVAHDLERYTGTRVSVSPDLRSLRVSGVLTIGDPAAVDRQIEALLPVRVEKVDGERRLVRAP